MAYVSLLIPFVLAYIFWAWRAINKKQISTEELNEEPNTY
jgi:cytochrome d ubiquinol oxidase subunit II